MALREDEAVVRGALRLGKVESQVPVDENGHQIGCGHRGRRVPRLRRRAHPHRVDAELLRERSPSLHRGHVAILRTALDALTLTCGAQQIARAVGARRQCLGRLAVARDARDGRAEAARPRRRGSRRHLEPDHLREGAVDRRLVRRATPRRARTHRRHARRSSSRSRSRTSSVRATFCDRSGSAPTESTGSSRSRSTPTSRTSATRRSSRRSC